MSALLKEFRDFAMRGNAVDMAIGIVIGAAFGKIVDAVVNQILMPPIGLLIGGVDFSDLAIQLKAATDKQPAVTIGYGVFINTLINFVIIAWALFMVMKGMNAAMRQKAAAPPPPPPPEPTKTEVLLTEIRDSLRTR